MSSGMVFPSLETFLVQYIEGGSCMLFYSYVEVWPMWFCVVLSWCVVENLCFWYFIECLFIWHQGTYYLADVGDLDVDIPQEGVYRPSSRYYYCLWIHFD